MAPTSQNDQPQRIERKLLAQTVRTDGQSLSHSRWAARLLNTHKAHSFVPIAQQTVNSRANCRFRGIFVEQFNSIDLVLIKFNTRKAPQWTFAWMDFSVARTSLLGAYTPDDTPSFLAAKERTYESRAELWLS